MSATEVALNASGLPAAEGVLAEANPNALSELFARNPETLSDDELSAIITELRSQRARWAKAEAEGKVGVGSRSKKVETKSTSTSLSLSDLGL